MMGLPIFSRCAWSSLTAICGRLESASPVSMTKASSAASRSSSLSIFSSATRSASGTMSSSPNGATKVRRSEAMWPKQPRSRPMSRAIERT
ncbi:hypothetical protein D3C87_1626600 [compost metagenome]